MEVIDWALIWALVTVPAQPALAQETPAFRPDAPEICTPLYTQITEQVLAELDPSSSAYRHWRQLRDDLVMCCDTARGAPRCICGAVQLSGAQAKDIDLRNCQ